MPVVHCLLHDENDEEEDDSAIDASNAINPADALSPTITNKLMELFTHHLQVIPCPTMKPRTLGPTKGETTKPSVHRFNLRAWRWKGNRSQITYNPETCGAVWKVAAKMRIAAKVLRFGATAHPIAKPRPMNWDQKRQGRRPNFLITKIHMMPPQPSMRKTTKLSVRMQCEPQSSK